MSMIGSHRLFVFSERVAVFLAAPSERYRTYPLLGCRNVILADIMVSEL